MGDKSFLPFSTPKFSPQLLILSINSKTPHCKIQPSQSQAAKMGFIKSICDWLNCKRAQKEDVELGEPKNAGVKATLERVKAEQVEKQEVRERNNATLAGQRDNLDKRMDEIRNGKVRQTNGAAEQAEDLQQPSTSGPSVEPRVETVAG